MSESNNPVIFEQRASTAWISLNRPDALNALDDAMIDELQHILDRTERDSSVRALVITGAGRAFCAGADISSTSGDEDAHAHVTVFLERLGRVFNQLEAFPKPTIAAVNGVAAGGGLELILCCDLVVAVESAKFADAHANYGFIPGGGSTVRLPRKIGINRAKFLLFTGQFASAKEMFDAGLVNTIMPPGELEQGVQKLADFIATKSPLGLQRMKELVNDGLDTPTHIGVRRELLASNLHRRSEDNQEGLIAFQEKRRPIFRGK